VPGAPTDRPVRVAFDGAPAALEAAAEDPSAPCDPTPDVVVVFDPSEGPPTGAVEAGAVTVAYLTRPATGADLTRFDRVLVTDRRLAAELGDGAVVWRAVPLPVADRLFGGPVTANPAAGPLVLGGSERDRRRVLRDHAPASSSGEPWIAINLHTDRDGGFEHRVAVQLAAGRLVLSEALNPRHGLEPGIDYVEFCGGRHLDRLVVATRQNPRAWRWMQVRGRQKAEHFRASRVWRRLAADVLADIAAFGRPPRG
jgi:hypothetical protein